MTDFPVQVYNVAFGDWDAEQKNINDSVITNNADKNEILATVAAAILEFIQYTPPDTFLYAKGSTLSRTRLYQMAISSFYSDISQLFVIKGYIKRQWHLFEKGVNYEAFLACRK